MKKTKKQINNEITKRFQVKIDELLLNQKYHEAVKSYNESYYEFKKNPNSKNINDTLEKKNKITTDFSFHRFSKSELEEIKRIGNLKKWNWDHLPAITSLMIEYPFSPVYSFKDTFDPKGSINFTIKKDTPRYIIHRLVDEILDRDNNVPLRFSAKKRFRKETLDALKIFEEKRLRKSFPQIAGEYNIKESTVKARYYRAYQILFKKKFNPRDFEKPEIKKEYLKRHCGNCTVYNTCDEICPDVAHLVNQDTAYLREKLL
jgi:hypothetical protein